MTATDIELQRLRAVLVEQRKMLTDDLRKADPAQWARRQIALGDAYVAIDPPRLRPPERELIDGSGRGYAVREVDYWFRTTTRRSDLPVAAYSAALSEAPHLGVNEIIHTLVCRGSMRSGGPQAVFDCQHAVIGRVPDVGRAHYEILQFLGERLREAPTGIDDRHYCEARAGLAEALIAFAVEGNRGPGNEIIQFSDGVRPYLEEAVEAARAAVSRGDPATLGRCRRVLMMALAALGATAVDGTLYDEALAIGSLAAEQHRSEHSAPEWQLLHYYLARVLEGRETLHTDPSAAVARIADCYRIAMEQPIFGREGPGEGPAPMANRLDRVLRQQAELEGLTIDRFLVEAASRLSVATPAARARWATEAAIMAARSAAQTAVAIVDTMHALATRHEEEVALWESWGDALASARSHLDADQLQARKNDLSSCVERFNNAALWRAWASLVAPASRAFQPRRDKAGLAELKSIAVRSDDAELRAEWSANARGLAGQPGKDMSPIEIAQLKQELRDFAHEFDEPELHANWCVVAIADIESKQYCFDNLDAVRELISATKPSARNNWNMPVKWPKAATWLYKTLFDLDQVTATALRADVKALADMVVAEPAFYLRAAGVRPEQMLYQAWNEMALYAIRTLSHSDVNGTLALFEELRSNRVTRRGMDRHTDCVAEASELLRGAGAAPTPEPAAAKGGKVVLHVADWSEKGTRAAVARFLAHVQSEDGQSVAADAADRLHFSAYGEQLTIAEFFRRAVATGHNLESEVGRIWRIYSTGAPHLLRPESGAERIQRVILTAASPDAPLTFAAVWCEAAIAGMTGQTLKDVRESLALGPDPDGSSSADPGRRLLDDIKGGLAAEQGWHRKDNVRAVMHDAMCRADGNPIYLPKGFMMKAAQFYAPREFAEMAVEQSRNLKWRVDGCESWAPQSYINLLVDGWSSSGKKPTAFERDVIAELRKLAIKEFTLLPAAAGKPLFGPSGQLVEGRTATEIARAAIHQAKSLAWRTSGYESWHAYDYLKYFVRSCLDPDILEHRAIEDELNRVLPHFRISSGHVY